MAHHQHLFHHKEGEQPGPITDNAGVHSQGVDRTAEIKHDKHKERLGELGAAAAAGFAAHEKHEVKKHADEGHRHRIEEEVAVPIAVGAGLAALHEHHNKKDAKEAGREAEGKHHKHHNV